MNKDLHTTATWCFYSLGTSFFIAWLLLQNQILVAWPTWWLNVADLPLLLSAMLFGGVSLYRSVRTSDKPHPILITVIAVPLTALFIFFVVLNFWVA